LLEKVNYFNRCPTFQLFTTLQKLSISLLIKVKTIFDRVCQGNHLFPINHVVSQIYLPLTSRVTRVCTFYSLVTSI